MTRAQAAAKLGLGVAELAEAVRGWSLEPTYSPAEVAAHFGCSVWQVMQLVRLGRVHGAALHPLRGGLWPTIKVSHKCRRIPLSAVERHARHMERAGSGRGERVEVAA